MTSLPDLLTKAGIKAAIISIDLTEPSPVWRVALSQDGADCKEMHGAGLNLEVAIHRALEKK